MKKIKNWFNEEIAYTTESAHFLSNAQEIKKLPMFKSLYYDVFKHGGKLSINKGLLVMKDSKIPNALEKSGWKESNFKQGNSAHESLYTKNGVTLRVSFTGKQYTIQVEQN